MYAELYDFAPIAYFTFDSYGVIREVNRSCVDLLALERGVLISRPFIDFIANKDEKETFIQHLSMVLQRKVILKCTLKLTNNNGTTIYGHLQSVSVTSKNRDNHILTSIVDGTVSKQFEETLRHVRELESAIERAVIIGHGPPLHVVERFEDTQSAGEPSGQAIKSLVELEHDHILQVLKKTSWRIEGKSGAAVILGLNASTLRARMRKYGIFRV